MTHIPEFDEEELMKLSSPSMCKYTEAEVKGREGLSKGNQRVNSILISLLIKINY